MEAGGRDGERDGFLLLRTISHFTYEMVNNTEKIAREGDFRKRRTGCPLLPARPVEYHISISLVKSDWTLQQKTEAPPAPFPAAPTPFVSVSFRPAWRLEKLKKLISVNPLFYNGGISPAYCG